MAPNGISVIFPALCREFGPDWIEGFTRAARSVLAQECRLPLELVIIDDGSIRPLAREKALSPIFADPRVRSIRLEQNSGLVYALNTGLTQAGFDLIARIDSDDAWRPGKLEQQIACFESDPDLTIVGTGMRLVHPEARDRDEDLIRPGTWKGVLRFMAEVGCPFPHGSILARKDIFFLLGGYSHDARVIHCEDFALWSIWLRFFKGSMVEAVFYDYTVSPASTTCAEQQAKASGRVHQRYLDLGTPTRIPRAMGRLAKNLGVSLIEAGKLCFLAWNFYTTIVADEPILPLLEVLLPDREQIRPVDIQNHLADRFLYFSWHPSPAGDHARVLHTLEDLKPFL